MAANPKHEADRDLLQGLIDRLREVGQEAGDRLAELLAEASVRERVDAVADRIDELTLELAKRVRHAAPVTPPLEQLTVEELHELASERGVKGRSGMHKAELIDALRKG